jgi:aspartate/methionine/tyrosine aminotransferase
VRNPRNHRYSTSKGIPKLRMAVSDLYQRTFGVELDFETEVCSTIGAKEGFSHLMLTLVGPGDTALVPSPSYPIHIWGPISPARPCTTCAWARSKTSSATCSTRTSRRGRVRA